MCYLSFLLPIMQHGGKEKRDVTFRDEDSLTLEEKGRFNAKTNIAKIYTIIINYFNCKINQRIKLCPEIYVTVPIASTYEGTASPIPTPPKNSIFCTLSQTNQHLLEKYYSKLSKELKNGVEILVRQAVF